jgi:hypothetical protein
MAKSFIVLWQRADGEWVIAHDIRHGDTENLFLTYEEAKQRIKDFKDVAYKNDTFFILKIVEE